MGRSRPLKTLGFKRISLGYYDKTAAEYVFNALRISLKDLNCQVKALYARFRPGHGAWDVSIWTEVRKLNIKNRLHHKFMDSYRIQWILIEVY